MKLTTALIALLSAGATPVLGLWGGADQAAVAKDNLKVPGDSPLELCDKKHDDDIITIDKVDLLPNPPEAGAKLVIKASGTVHEKIDQGAYVQLSVKYGLIKLISTTADLCEQIGNVDLECPIEKGAMTIKKDVDLPKQIPPGKYTVVADVYTGDDVPITCLTATVAFGGRRAQSFFEVEL